MQTSSRSFAPTALTILVAPIAPMVTASSVFDCVRFYTVVVWPPFTKAFASADPMAPNPTKVTLPIASAPRSIKRHNARIHLPGNYVTY